MLNKFASSFLMIYYEAYDNDKTQNFNYSIDINYSNLVDFSEMSFVYPGPGALDGIKKCFEGEVSELS